MSSGGATFVAVVQAAYLRERNDLACAGWLDRSRVRRVLAEGEVRARAVVVREVRPEDSAEVGFAKDDDVVEAVAANGAHEALGEWILPRRVRCDLDLFDAKAGDALSKRGPVEAIAVAQQVARGRVFRKCLDDLLGGPLGAGFGSHVPMHHPASVDRKHQEDIEDAEGRGGHGEEVDAGERPSVVDEERPPSLATGSCACEA
jgi:hypothetical protein